MSSLWCHVRTRFLQAGLIGSVAVCVFTVILLSALFLGSSVDADVTFRRILIAGGVGVALGLGIYLTARQTSR